MLLFPLYDSLHVYWCNIFIRDIFFGHYRTSKYDSRARERRRQIEDQKSVAARLLKQVRLADYLTSKHFHKLLLLS